MSFRESIESGKWVTLVEVRPPKGTDLREICGYAEQWKGRIDAISVTDLQGAVMRTGSLSASYRLKSAGTDVIFNLSPAHRNRIALQSELLNASTLGLENLLIVPGDPPSMGDHFEAQEVRDLDRAGLVYAVRRLQDGFDLMGNELHGAPKFFVGAMLDASAQSLDQEMSEIEKMIDSGVRFLLATSVYDARNFEVLSRRISRFNVPLIAGITLLKSLGMARYISQHVSRTPIPEWILDSLSKASDKRRASIEIAVKLISSLRQMCQGVLIVPVGWEDQVLSLLDAL